MLQDRGVRVIHLRGDGRAQTEAELAAEEKFRKTGGQLNLFETEEPGQWKSTQSVLPKKSAAEFFGILRRAGIRRLIDVRLNNTSQLAAFAKRDDLQFFLRELCDADYHHEPTLAPTEEMLDAYKKKTDRVGRI